MKTTMQCCSNLIVLITIALSAGCAQIAGLEERGQGPAVLADNQKYPGAIAVKGDFVYWATEAPRDQTINETRAIRRTLRTGGGVPAVIMPTTNNRALALTVDETHVYWYERKDPEDVTDCGAEHPDGIRRVPVGGGSPEALYSQCFWDQDIALTTDSARLYYSAEDWNRVYWIDKADTSKYQEIGYDQYNAMSVVVDGKGVYWTVHDSQDPSYSFVRRYDKGSGDMPVVDTVGSSTGHIAEWLTQDDQELFWTTRDGHVFKVRKDAPADSAGTEIAIDFDDLSAIVADESHIYVADSGTGRIVRMNKDGSEPITMAEGQGYPYRMAIDDIAVYWTNQTTGQVMVLRKD